MERGKDKKREREGKRNKEKKKETGNHRMLWVGRDL